MLKTTMFKLQELREYYFNGETLFFTCNAIQQLNYSQASNQFYFTKVKTIKNFCPRGRYHAYKPEYASKYL